jgi:hypothetical protein
VLVDRRASLPAPPSSVPAGAREFVLHPGAIASSPAAGATAAPGITRVPVPLTEPPRDASSSATVQFTALVLVALGTAYGFARNGVVGAGVGLMLAGCVATVLLALDRYRQHARSLDVVERSAATLAALPPQQALAVIDGMVAAGGRAGLRSELLRRVDGIVARSTAGECGPEAAYVELLALRREHPRSPAVMHAAAELARATGRLVEAQAHASEALRLALDGGMNPLAGRVFSAFADERERLQLERTHLQRLSAVMAHHGRDDLALWCRERAAA